MKKKMIVFWVVIGLITLISCQAYANNTIKIGYWITEPEVIADPNSTMDKNPKGTAVDYWEKYIAPGMGVKIEWVGPVNLARLQSWLEDGTIDATVWLGKNPERVAKFVYPVGSFAETQSGLAVLKSNPLNKIEKVSDISNLKIGYTTEALITPFMKDPSIKFEMVSAPDHLRLNIPKLASGRIDAVYSPDIVSLKYTFKKLSNVNNFKFLPLPEKSNEIYSIFSKKANPELVKKYDAVNEKTKANYAKLLKDYVD